MISVFSHPAYSPRRADSRPLSLVLRLAAGLVLGVFLASATGCDSGESVRVYEAPRLPEPPKPDRMLGAVVVNNETAWFVKATAPRQQIEALQDEFREFVASFQFTPQGDPQWELPDGWDKSDEVVQLRYATLTAPAGDATVDVSVSQLPYPGPDRQNDYLLRNVNRWRGQLGERPMMLVELLRDLEQVPTAAGEDAFLVSLEGKQSSAGRSMPFAHPPVSGATGDGGVAKPSVAPPVGGGRLQFTAPDEWTEGRTGGMRKAAFTVGEGDAMAEITVIDLPGNSGTFPDNVNRWRGQVMLEPAAPAEIEADAETVDVGGVEGKLVELVGPRESILGVIAPSGDKTWFIKMRGDASTTDAEKERFRKFVNSLQLP